MMRIYNPPTKLPVRWRPTVDEFKSSESAFGMKHPEQQNREKSILKETHHFPNWTPKTTPNENQREPPSAAF
jgi:hypothetical protein